MKTTAIHLSKTKMIFMLKGFMLLSVFLTVMSCKKDKFPTDLGGEVDIALTEVGNKTDASVTIGDVTIPGTLEVINRTSDGIVTYHAIIDYSSLPEADILDDLIDDQYQDGPGKVEADFRMKITSEGYMDFFAQEKPWLDFRYSDPVGTKYQITQSDGNVLTRTVVAKSTDDDFFWGGMLIKTITVEQEFLSNDPIAKKLTIRGNHRFGLVNANLELISGEHVNINLYPWNY